MKTFKSIINHDAFIVMFCLSYVAGVVSLACIYNNVAIAGFGLIIIPLLACGVADCLIQEKK